MCTVYRHRPPLNPYVHCLQTYAGVTATVTGWGTTSSQGSLSSTLKEVNVGVVSNGACKYVFICLYFLVYICTLNHWPGMTTATPAVGSPPTCCVQWWLGEARTHVRETQVTSLSWWHDIIPISDTQEAPWSQLMAAVEWLLARIMSK